MDEVSEEADLFGFLSVPIKFLHDGISAAMKLWPAHRINIKALVASVACLIALVIIGYLVQKLGHLLSHGHGFFRWRTAIWIALAVSYVAILYKAWDQFFKDNALHGLPTEWSACLYILSSFIFLPVSSMLIYAHNACRTALQWFTTPLHDDLKRIIDRCIGIWIVIWLSIYGVLVVVNLTLPKEQACRWVFPRIMSCLLWVKDGLAGGLIGAGGTIFAAWLAWAAIQRQIERKEDSAGPSPEGPKQDN